LADRDLESGRTITAAKKLYGAITRIEVFSAVFILVLCTVFALETRPLRNLFYAVALPVFLLNLHAFGCRPLWKSDISKVSVAYLAYFLFSAAWSHDLSLPALADLLRVTLLLLLFCGAAVLLAARDGRFEQRLFSCYSLAAGASLLVVFAAMLTGLVANEIRQTGFGLATH
jgi:hypothetical protein